MNDKTLAQNCFRRVHALYTKEGGLQDSLTQVASDLKDSATQTTSKARNSLNDKEFVKKLLRAGILGAGGAAVGGLGGSLLKTKKITYDQYGRPKRKTRAGLGALLGGATGASVGLLANPEIPYEEKILNR